MTTINKGLIAAEDVYLWPGTEATKTFTRESSGGHSLTLHAFGGEVDVLMVYGAGVNFTAATINAALTAVGTTYKRALVLRPGSWVLEDNVTIPANVTLVFCPGAIITTTGYTLTINGEIQAGHFQIFTGTGTTTFKTGSKVKSAWYSTINLAISGCSTAQVNLVVSPGTHTLTASATIPATLNVIFYKGAIIATTSTYTLTINGSIRAGHFQIFSAFTTTYNVILGTKVREAYPEWWGAAGDGTTDDVVPMHCCLQSGANEILLSAKTYYIGGTGFTLTTNRTIVKGQGIESALYFNPSAANCELFYSDENLDNIEFRDFYCKFQNAGSKAAGTAFQFTSNVNSVKWHNIYISDFTAYGINRDSGMYDLIDNCRFVNMDNSTLHTALAVAINYTTYANAIVIQNSRFGQNDQAINIAGGHGIRIVNNSFELDGDSGNSAGITDIVVVGSSDMPTDGLVFAGNYVEGETTGTGYAFLYIDYCYGTRIEGNMMEGSSGATTYSDYLIHVGSNCVGTYCEGNMFSEVLTGFIDADALVVTRNNRYKDGSSALTTYNGIMAKMNNPQYVELDIDYTATIDVDSLSDGAGATTSDQTITGLALGDCLLVGCGVDTTGLTITGNVKAANTANLRVQNESTGTINLASTTWRVKVIKAK